MIDRFALAYREQQQLFLFDKAYVGANLLKIGGLSTLSARFIVQFFWNPVVAQILTLGLLALGTWLLWLALRRSRADWPLLPLCVIPFFFLAASLSENAMHFDVLTAWFLSLAALCVYTRIKTGRSAWGIVLTVLVYLVAGPAALLFALSATIVGLFRREWASLSFLPVALLCALFAWWMTAVPTWQAACTPAFYFDLDTEMPTGHWVAWIVLPVIVFLVEWAKVLSLSRKVFLPAVAVLAVLAFLPALQIARKCEVRQSGITYEYEYYTVNQDWEGLRKACLRHEWVPHTAQYLNLALAWKGTLVEDLLRYDQRGPTGLVRMDGQRGVETTQAHIMFAMGNMAGAQDIAFNTLYSVQGICPAMLKMNAQVELMRGTYEVADRYLSFLEKSLHYRRWAREHRRFLYDDEAVEADPLLGNGRRDFPVLEGFSMFESPISELLRVVDANPSDPRATQYALAYLLLSKDAESVCRFVDTYYGSPSLRSVPVPVQEAILFFSEYSRNVRTSDSLGPEWCRSHGVTPQTEQRFAAFQQATLASGGAAPKGYQGTYWHYLLYKQI